MGVERTSYGKRLNFVWLQATIGDTFFVMFMVLKKIFDTENEHSVIFC